MIIRHALAQDLPVIARLSSQAFGASAWDPGVFQRLLLDAFSRPRHALLLVAEGGPAGIVGYLVLQVVLDEAEIQALAVERSCRRRGVATALLREGIAFCQEMGAATIFLEVRESNAAARAFYEERGFSRYGKRLDYYRHPSEDAVLMRLSLVNAGTGDLRQTR